MLKSALLSGVLAGVVVAQGGEFDGLVNKINSGNHGWTAEVPTRFGSLREVKKLCGTWTKGHPLHVPQNFTRAPEDISPANAIPESFDARTNWPHCTVISKIRDQSSCGSCWAFGSTEAFEDSRCVATKEDVMFSPEDTAGCCSGFSCGFSMGCNGGQPSAALGWMTKKGVVTGGDYFNRTKANDGCKPYSLKPCAHHVAPSSEYPKCPEKEYKLTCEKECTDTASGKTYDDDKQKATTVHSYDTVEGMQTAIMTTGPLAVAFTVYEDLPAYKSGVYKKTSSSGQALGGHAVEMIGWGVEDGQDYWIIKNSWNQMWGDNGTFKIARGTNECGIESDVTGVKFS